VSFNAQNITCPWYVLGFALAVALTPVAPGAGPWFWAGSLVSVALFALFFTLLRSGDPGLEFCCGLVLLLPTLAIAGYLVGWTLNDYPRATAIAPWIALSAGPTAGITLRLGLRAWRRLRGDRLQRRIAGLSLAELPPLLIDAQEDVAQAALDRVEALSPDLGARCELVTATASLGSARLRRAELLEQLAAPLAQAGAEQREALLACAAETDAPGPEQALKRLTWDDSAPLLALAEARLDHQLPADLPVQLLLRLDRERGTELARRSYLRGRLSTDTLGRLDPRACAEVLSAAMALDPQAEERPYGYGVAEASLRLAADLAAPLVLRGLTSSFEGAFVSQLEEFAKGKRVKRCRALGATAEGPRLREVLTDLGARYPDNPYQIERFELLLAAFGSSDEA